MVGTQAANNDPRSWRINFLLRLTISDEVMLMQWKKFYIFYF